VSYSETRHYNLTLGLDRIEKITEASSAFKESDGLKSEQYFADTLGVTVGKGPAEDIVLWFSPKQAPYIKTQHLHHSQTTVSDDDSGLVISCKLITPSPELVSLVLSYGADVKVISPITLKDTITETIRHMVNLYPD
jgi:predicted DNA-binding transcriptional regulator YafY